MKTLLPLAAALSALSLGACATYSNGPIVNGGPVRQDGMAMLGQPTRVGSLVATPQVLVEDSRCPMNARCVWAGRVRVKMLWIRGNGEKQPFEATLGEPVQLADGQFTLESVRPEKMTNVALKPTDYRFSFRFAGGL